MTLLPGESYSVRTPGVDGYTARMEWVEGRKKAESETIVVLLDPNDRPNRGVAVDLTDYGTPLGISNSILGTGEIIE